MCMCVLKNVSQIILCISTQWKCPLCVVVDFHSTLWIKTRRPTNSLSLCSFLPLLRARERDSGSKWGPGTSFPSGPGANGRRQNVVPEKRLGRCKICKSVTQNHSRFFCPSTLVKEVTEKVARFHRTCLLFDESLTVFVFLLSLTRSWRPMDWSQYRWSPKRSCLKPNSTLSCLT